VTDYWVLDVIKHSAEEVIYFCLCAAFSIATHFEFCVSF
jgi:hypothetical protein